MSDKKCQKSIEELCRSRLSRTAGGEMLPSLSQTSNHRLLRSPSPRESFSRTRRRTENTTARHSLFPSRPLSTDLIPGIPKQRSSYEAEKRRFFQNSHEAVKKPFFLGFPPQIVTHADPPFSGTDTQPLPPISMPRVQEEVCVLEDGEDNRPFTVYGQKQFEMGASCDFVSAASEERRGKRKLEAIKRLEDQEKPQEWRVSRQYREREDYQGKKKCAGNKIGKRTRKFPKPLAWKSPWPDQDDECGSDAEWTDIN